MVIIGSGGHARVLIDCLRLLSCDILFLTDSDPTRHGSLVSGINVRGDDPELFLFSPDEVKLVNAVGSIERPHARREVYQRFRDRGYTFRRVLHPSAVIADSVILAQGVQVMAGGILQCHVTVAENALINTGASIDHDCRVGEHSHIAPGATLSGNVRVGSMTHVGAGSTVIQSVGIGDDVLIGAGSVVVRDIASGASAWGVPARPRPARPASKSDRKTCNIMLSAAGRRVGLVQLLRKTLDELDLDGRIIATDVNPTSAAFHMADQAFVVPSYRDPSCLETLLKLCSNHDIRLIVPTIDTELSFYARHLREFESIGTKINISAPETIEICNDKSKSHDWLASQGLVVLPQTTPQGALADESRWPFPLFTKPRHGSSSNHARIVLSRDDLVQHTAKGSFVVERIARGHEYTIDTFVDKNHRCVCAVPRKRLEVRGGEVSKGITLRHNPLMDTASKVVENLPGAYGVLNVQAFFDAATDELAVSEINPRFGGGYPLSHAAGAPMMKWLIEDAMQLPSTASPDKWRDGLVMLRYDDAVYVDRRVGGVE